MLRVHVFSLFTSKTPRTHVAFVPFGVLVVKKLKKSTLTIT